MKRVLSAVFITVAALSPMAHAADNDFFTSPAVRRDAATISRPDDALDSSRHLNSDSRTGGPSGTLHYTVFHFDSKYGDILLQPVLGKINGARLYVSW